MVHYACKKQKPLAETHWMFLLPMSFTGSGWFEILIVGGGRSSGGCCFKHITLSRPHEERKKMSLAYCHAFILNMDMLNYWGFETYIDLKLLIRLVLSPQFPHEVITLYLTTFLKPNLTLQERERENYIKDTRNSNFKIRVIYSWWS